MPISKHVTKLCRYARYLRPGPVTFYTDENYRGMNIHSNICHLTKHYIDCICRK